MENSSDQEQDGKDKSVKSSSLIGSLMPRILKEAQKKRGFALIALTKEAHMSLSRIAKLAIRQARFVYKKAVVMLSAKELTKALKKINWFEQHFMKDRVPVFSTTPFYFSAIISLMERLPDWTSVLQSQDDMNSVSEIYITNSRTHPLIAKNFTLRFVAVVFIDMLNNRAQAEQQGTLSNTLVFRKTQIDLRFEENPITSKIFQRQGVYFLNSTPWRSKWHWHIHVPSKCPECSQEMTPHQKVPLEDEMLGERLVELVGQPKKEKSTPISVQKGSIHSERVKISSTNVRLETTVPQKEETFQVVIDLIKISKCFKAFTISADVLEIVMQQFWYTIKKVQGIDSYEFS
ncbi:hypothetical protein Tco_0102981 [Tanacetum coccineum]